MAVENNLSEEQKKLIRVMMESQNLDDFLGKMIEEAKIKGHNSKFLLAMGYPNEVAVKEA